MIFRDTSTPPKELHGTQVVIMAGAGVSLDYDSTGIPRLTFSGGGGSVGPGSTGKITKWTGTNTVGDSIMSESGSVITVSGSVTTSSLTLSTSASKIIPGATSLSLRNNADSRDNLLILDSGESTFSGSITGSTFASPRAGLWVMTSVSGDYPGGIYVFPTLTHTANSQFGFGGYINAGTVDTGGFTGLTYEALAAGGGPDTILGGGSFALSAGMFIAHPTPTMAAATMTERVGLEIQNQYWATLTPASSTEVYAIRTGTGKVSFGDVVWLTATTTNPQTNIALCINSDMNVVGNVQQYAASFQPTFSTAATTDMVGQYIKGTAAAGSYTTTNVRGLWIDTFAKAGSQTITNWYGIYVATGPTAGTKWGLYVQTDPVFFGSDVSVGSKITVADNNTTSSFASGNVTIGGTTITAASLNLILKSEAGKNRQIVWQTGASSTRWMMRTNNTAEGGSNAGSDFEMYRYDDAGSAIGPILTLKRSSGLATFENSVAVKTSLWVTPSTTPDNSIGMCVNYDVTLGTGSTQYGMAAFPTFSSAATAGMVGLYASGTGGAGSYTTTNVRGLWVDTFNKGASQTITNWYGAYIGPGPTAGTKWGLYVQSDPTFLGGDLTLGTLGKIDSTTAPTADYSLVYDGATSKWKPRLINASLATSGVVSAGSLPDGTTAAWVNTQPTLSGAPGTPTTTGPTYTLGYRCIIVKMGGASANQMYAVDMTSNGTFYSGRFSITSGLAVVTVTGGTPNTFVSTDVGRYIDIAGAGPAGTNGVLHAKIITFTSATQVTVDTNATNTVSSANGMIGSFMGFDQRACTTGSTTTNIVFTTPGWTINQWKGYQVVCNSASGGSAGNVGQVRTILSNTTTALVFDTANPWPAAPLNTDQFTIAPVLTTADTFVHAGLQDAAVMWYRFRTVGGASTYLSTDYGPNTVQTAGTTVSSVSYVNAFGLVVASQLAVTNLSAISGTMSALTVGTGASGNISAGSILTSQFQSAATRTKLDPLTNRIYMSGGNLQLNTGGAPETNNVLLGDFSVTVGTPPTTKTNVTEGSGSYTNNATDTVSVGSPNAPAWASSTSLATLTTAITTSLPAVDTNYTVFGQMVTSTTTTSGTVSGFSSCNSRVRVEYQTSAGGAWTDVGEVATDNISPGGATSTINWSVTVPISGTPSALNFRLVYEISLSCTKVTSGVFTCSGSSAAFPTVGVQWLFSAGGTVFTRRGLKLYGITSKPHIAYGTLAAALTTSNSIEGESWYTAGTVHALQINDGTQVVSLGAASTTQEGVIKLAKHLGGTFLAPIVIALNASGTDVNVGSAAAPSQFQVLRANSSTAATWQDIPGTPSGYPHLRAPFGFFAPGTGTVQGFINLPATPTVSGGALSAQVDGYYTAYTSGAVNGNQAGVVTTTFTITRMNFNPTIYMRIRTAAAANSLRAWFGLTSVSQTANSDTATGSCAMFRLNGLTLVGVCRDGTTQQTTATLATLANSTSYLLKIRVTGTNTIAFSVNGGAETTLSTNVPAATTALGIQINTTCTASLATTINVAYVQGEHGR